jgi:SAM-dependent methyltransferase
LSAWRAYMHQVYSQLIREWLHPDGKIVLKTDLFEEAVSSHAPFSELGARAIGLDVSWKVVKSAQERIGPNTYRLFTADLRHIPLLSEKVDCILSGSSLDHFSVASDLDQSLSELARILQPGGILVLTLDNPHNPLIWIRNHLPFHLLNRLRIVPYYVGKTLSRGEAQSKLESYGFTISHVQAVVHVPRAPAIWMVRIAERYQWNADWMQSLFQSFEGMSKWPTRFLSGYYLAIHAVKNKNVAPLRETTGKSDFVSDDKKIASDKAAQTK